MDLHLQALQNAIVQTEADIAREVRILVGHVRCPMTRKDKAALRHGMARITSLRHMLAMRTNQFRGGHRRAGDAPLMTAAPRPWPPHVPPGQAFLNDLDVRARRLALVMEALDWMVSRRPQPLYPPPAAKADPRAEQLAVSDRVFRALHRVVNPAEQDAGSAEMGCFPDIPLMPSVFLEHAQAALRVGMAQGRRALRFIDVGCGGGVKVMLAAEIFAQADGLEYDPGYVAAAMAAVKLLSVARARVFQADALHFDGYGDYDVIYFYQPMQREDELIALEQRIAAGARPGTILIAPYQFFGPRAAALGCAHIAGGVYVAGIDAAKAEVLRRRAETTGTHLLRADAPILAVNGYLTPLIKAARQIGFDIG